MHQYQLECPEQRVREGGRERREEGREGGRERGKRKEGMGRYPIQSSYQC